MAVNIPFPLPATGYALNSKVRVNLDFLVDQFNQFNSGTATWDNVSVGTPNNLTGTVTFYNSSNAFYLTLQAGATSGNITYTLPATNPSLNNALLRVQTTGVLSWTDYSFDVSTADNGLLWISGGTSIDALTNAQGTNVILTGSSATSATPKWVQFLGTANQITVTYASNDITLSLPQNINTTADFQANSIRTSTGTVSSCALQIGVANIGFIATGTSISAVIAGATQILIDNTGGLVTNGELRGGTVRSTGNVEIGGSGNKVTIGASGGGSAYTLTLPINDGDADDILTTDGSGVLSWVPITSVGGANANLSNLVSVAINTTLVSDTNNTDDLGTSSIAWKNLYLSGAIYSGATELATTTELGYLDGVSSNIQTQFSGKAATALSNLASVAINTSLVSDTDNTDDLGTSSVNWKDLYLKGDVKVGSTTAIDLSSTAGVSIRGTDTNNSASSGFVGEHVSSAVATGSAVSATGNLQWFDITSISLSAGDWDISAIVVGKENGSTMTAWTGAIGSVSGNDGTGIVSGDNRMNCPLPTAAQGDLGCTLPTWRVSLSGSATYYLKALFVYSAGTPQAYGRISARRVR